MPTPSLGMWDDWQIRVRKGLPLFAKSPLYVDQGDVDLGELEQIATTLPPDPDGQIRDVVHGGRIFQTKALGPVTRMWIDGCVEIGFLRQTLGPARLATCDVLDIGAGYGRLAVMLSPFVRSYLCVDPVRVSTEVCRTYTARYAPSVRVLSMDQFGQMDGVPTLAINVHSWNECTAAQITGWLERLASLGVPLLFTVSHTSAYQTWDRQNFRHLLEARYRLVAEEAIGLGRNPHALWERR